MPYYFDSKKLEFDNVLRNLRKAMYTSIADIKTTAWCSSEPLPFNKRRSGKKMDVAIGDKWGDLFDCAWFHFTGKVPKTAAGKHVVLLLNVSGEMCVFDKDGNAVLGLTAISGWSDDELMTFPKRVVSVSKRAKGTEKIDIWADAGCNDLFGRLYNNGLMKQASVASCNEQLRCLYYDFEVLWDLAKSISQDSARCQQLISTLCDASQLLVDFTEDEAIRARKILAPQLKKKGGDPSLTVSAIGHAHLDLAWLWPIRETIRKGARTFSTALDLMNKYPDYVFGASQPQLYAWIKEQYPSVYRKIKRRVKQGRWEVQGGMWVEADANVPSGESLVRQFLYGKRFFRDEFGVDVKDLWLPDVFGYSGALPQILKKCGIEYFMTQKLSWNETNTHPHHTFIWQGIDGSEVLTHMPPENDYNSSATPAALIKAEKNYLDKAVSDRCLLLFGIGDGGGGPGAEHLERLSRVGNLSGLPQVIQEPSAKLFERLEKDRAKYKTWEGELYLEKHRGTYTSQARNKRYNRKMELGLRELEFVSVITKLTAKTKYPKAQIEQLWKETLLYQFHDILPGSSIKRVYDESLERYESMVKQTGKLLSAADKDLVAGIDTGDAKKPAVVINSLSFGREEWIEIDGKWVKVKVPSMGFATVDLAESVEKVDGLAATTKKLENDSVRVVFKADGSIGSVYDKINGREVIAKGSSGNRLTVYVDKPREWDAWDIAEDYADRAQGRFELKSAKAFIDGPRAVCRQEYTFSKSRLTQEIVITDGSARVDFVTEVDWDETQKMLRTSFAVDVKADYATYEIQYGNVKRPTHGNTSWDGAKYEVCAHKWVDLSQGDFGVAILNDCKYGHKVWGNILDLNLLRSPISPDMVADRCNHEFAYSIYPHIGGVAQGGVVREGYAVNVPLRGKKLRKGKGALSSERSFVSVSADNVVVEAVKRAEDSGDVVIRLYECHGCGANARIQLGFDVESAVLVDMMEEGEKRLRVSENAVNLQFKPFEIHTIRVKTKG